MIEVEQDGKTIKLPDANALAARNRRESGHVKQQPRRQREYHVRCRAADFVAYQQQEGMSCRQSARQLCINARTLSHWRCCHRRGTLACRPRGRPCKQSPASQRVRVVEHLCETTPSIGIPTLQLAFPEVPHCELCDIRQDYYEVYRAHNKIVRADLAWHGPGRVWAVDHTKPPNPVDGMYPKIFAVRDLASGMELAWQPVPDETAVTTRDILLALFREHGAPLVLKSDNGPAFKRETQDLLKQWHVPHLLSPPETPQYNGSREAGIGWLKTRTHYLASEPGFWTSEDTEAARRLANEEHYPRGYRRPNAQQLWEERDRVSQVERSAFYLTLREQESLMQQEADLEKNSSAQEAKMKRDVIRRTLVERGILSVTWRSITLPIKPRKCAKFM